MKVNRWNVLYDKDPQIKRIGIFGSIYLIIIILVGLILLEWKFLVNAFFGGMISLLNFFWLKHLVDDLMIKPYKKKIFYPAIKYVIRLGLMAVVIYAIINFISFHSLGFILGFSAIVAAVTFEGCYQIAKGKHIGKD